METKSGIILLVIITAVIIGAILSYFYLPQGPPLPTFSSVSKPKMLEIIPPPATGNVDDAVSAFLEEVNDEQPVLTEEESDTSLITTDSQEVSDFGQSINDSDL